MLPISLDTFLNDLSARVGVQYQLHPAGHLMRSAGSSSSGGPVDLKHRLHITI